MVIYGDTTIPSDQIEVLAGGTVAISAAFENSQVIVGGMDTANGTATPGDLVEVSSPSDAQGKFGDGSELHEQAKRAFQNGVSVLHMLPVTETSVTAETHGTQSGTLDNAPIFDPNVQDEHSITVNDTGGGSLDVNIVYESSPSQPTSTDTVNVNPTTGEYSADAAPDGTDYEFDYDYGDYSATALQAAVDESPRMISLCTESETIVNNVATEVNSSATDFDFMHVVSGADVEADPSAYSDSIDERRVSLVSPARGYTDEAETNEVRTVGAIGAYLASLPLGLSSTNDSIGGFTGLRVNHTPSDAGDLIDAQVMPLIDYPPVTIVKDMTTSTEAKFERVYGMQVIDEATEISHLISREFVGEQNTSSQRNLLARSHKNAYIGMEDSTPPLLDDFTVSVSEDGSDPNKTNVTIGLDIVDIMDTIDVTITVGDIIRNEGAA